jgi:hypothetical protein
MNLDSLSYTLAQISYLVSNLSKKNYKPSVQEILDVSTTRNFGGPMALFFFASRPSMMASSYRQMSSCRCHFAARVVTISVRGADLLYCVFNCCCCRNDLCTFIFHVRFRMLRSSSAFASCNLKH